MGATPRLAYAAGMAHMLAIWYGISATWPPLVIAALVMVPAMVNVAVRYLSRPVQSVGAA